MLQTIEYSVSNKLEIKASISEINIGQHLEMALRSISYQLN